MIEERVALEGSQRSSAIRIRAAGVLSWWLFSLALLFISCTSSKAQSLAVVKDTSQGRPDLAVSDRPSNALPAASPLWRSFIWEAIPSEWLTDVSRQPILDAYQQNDWMPFFINGRFEVNERASHLIAKLMRSDEHAIDSTTFKLDKLNELIQKMDHCRVALQNMEPNALDRSVQMPETGAFIYEEGTHNPMLPVQDSRDSSKADVQTLGGAREIDGRIQDVFRAASRVDIQLTQNFLRYSNAMNPFARDEQFSALSGQRSMQDYLQSLPPRSPQYRTLQAALQKYRKLAQDYPRQHKLSDASVRPGESGSLVRELQTRLQQEGFYQGKITGTYDSETRRAVEAFQTSHMLGADGVAGKSTIEWLNVSYDHKARMIAVSMRSLCESPTRQYEKYVRINIPQFKLEYIKDGQVKDVHRVIVGKASGKKVKLHGRVMGENQTPSLASSIEQVVVNPRWYVTDRIYRELAGGALVDPDYFSRHGYVQMSSAYSSGAPRVFQEPGPSNPLGQVKFEFPNAFAVFLHDTPKKHLFSQPRRDFSHGCIRVEDAKKLAQTLLADDAHPASSKFEDLFKGRRPRHLKLNEPVPIVVEYVPVSASDGDRVIFCNDLYGIFKDSAQSKG
jgi:murein L,D-transpeptidase YcbB/YkuD